MSLSLITESHGPLEWVPAYPRGYKGPRLAGCTPYHASGDFGSVLMQEVIHGQFALRLFGAKFFRKMVVRWKESHFLRAQFVLEKSSLDYRREQDSIQVDFHHFNLVWAPEQVAEAVFEEGKDYRFMVTLFDPFLVQQLLPSFPEKDIPQEHRIFPMTSPQIKLVNNLQSNPHNGTWQSFYYLTNVCDLLFQTLSSEHRLRNYNEVEFSFALKVDAFIMADIRKHYTLEQLAEIFMVKSSYLSRIYKAVMGVGIYERLRKARMEKAIELLLTTNLQIQQIFHELGYANFPHFSESFKQYCGLPPLTYRNKFRPKT